MNKDGTLFYICGREKKVFGNLTFYRGRKQEDEFFCLMTYRECVAAEGGMNIMEESGKKLFDGLFFFGVSNQRKWDMNDSYTSNRISRASMENKLFIQFIEWKNGKIFPRYPGNGSVLVWSFVYLVSSNVARETNAI